MSVRQPDLPGTKRRARRFRPEFHYELIVCGLRGHELVGMDAAQLRPEDGVFAREAGGLRWYRCLRCDSWLPLQPPFVGRFRVTGDYDGTRKSSASAGGTASFRVAEPLSTG